ncbi:hypothetical protein LIER_23386 [Lithospermum erythrorhizon]|uniref:Aminotransferase-like plant mobile domain-containing protein n=1 Tax=Lithospermum erythrorhizon TaxID=34254 RepID=A0AAV3QYS3_LITER
MLANASLTGSVQASLCVYDCSDELLKAFCKNWCPSTNTLIIPQGELSVSLWDLLELGGLSVTGCLFDEAVPTAESCRFFLSGYEAVDQSNSKVASLNMCPRRSSVVEHSPWVSTNKNSFDVLKVGIDLEEELYCATFLSCRLCVFVLPAEPLDLIHASVFKMGSFMANGSKVSLAPPVLACIYRGLSQISLSNNPSAAPECFPAHYLFDWIGSYLHAHHTTTNRPVSPQMMRYHGKDRGKVYALSEARSVLHSARQTVTLPGHTTPNSPPVSYNTWLNMIFLSEAPRSLSMKHGKGKSLPTGVHPSTLIFQLSGSSKRTRSSNSITEDRDPKHARVTIAQQAKTILRTGASFLWSCICNGLKRKSPEMVLKEEENVMKTFKILSQIALGDFSDLHDKLQGFFQKAREMETGLSVTSPDSTYEALQKLPLLG